MNLQPLYDVKSRLEQAAIAGTGLLAEDFRLQRAAEGLKPLAAASPVFAKIDSGLQKLLSAPAEERGGQLLDLLALVDAVAYTQGGSGMAGELTPLSHAGVGTCESLSYGQLQPLLEALTGTGGGRMNLMKDMWENHPEYFGDFRVLPGLITGLGEGYAELAVLIEDILKAQRPEITVLLKKDFDPAGKKDMVRRVEVISALEGPAATDWLKEVLPEAKKDVRGAIITALGADPQNGAFLLELSKGERGSNRDAALQSLALQEGKDIQEFWQKEVAKNGGLVRFLTPASSDWASDLVAAGLKSRIEQAMAEAKPLAQERSEELFAWLSAANHKASPAMQDFWRWAGEHLSAAGRILAPSGQPLRFEGHLIDGLFSVLCVTDRLSGLCLELWEKDGEGPRYLPHALVASMFTRPAAEVYDRFSPYVLTAKPLVGAKQKQELHDGVLKGLSCIHWDEEQERYVVRYFVSVSAYLPPRAAFAGDPPTAQPLDSRWIKRLTEAVWKTSFDRQRMPFNAGELVDSFDVCLAGLVNPSDEVMLQAIVPWLRRQAVETGSWIAYSRWLLNFGVSPRGILADSMKKSKRAPHLYLVWNLLYEASQALPPDEVAALLEEIRDAGFFCKNDQTRETVFTKTIADLRAGRAFPEWNAWNI